jgi:hypothetical protein
MEWRIAQWALMPFMMLCFSIGSTFLIHPIFFISGLFSILMIFYMFKFSYNSGIENNIAIYENSVRFKSYIAVWGYVANLCVFAYFTLGIIFLLIALLAMLCALLFWYESNKILRHIDEKSKNDHSA